MRHLTINAGNLDLNYHSETYDYNNNILVDTTLFLGIGHFTKSEYYYNQNQKLSLNLFTNNNGSLNKSIYNYDSLNRKSLELNTMDGYLYEYKIIKYQRSSNFIKEIEIYNDRGVLRENIIYEYKFDKVGNWIKKEEYINGKLNEIIEREIEYYDD